MSPKTRTAADLEADWADRVRANRVQAERFREDKAGDFYAPVSNLFVADPRRSGEPALDALLAMASADESWLDIGAGAGRYALPLALKVREILAVEPSGGMRRALRTGMSEHGIANVRVIAGAWPDAMAELETLPAVDTALIAHVGYDIEAIGPFLDAMEQATRRRCIAMLTDRSPASVADPFWPLVHGEERVPLPALPDLVELLRARGRTTAVEAVERSPRSVAAHRVSLTLRRSIRPSGVELFWVLTGDPGERLTTLVHDADEQMLRGLTAVVVRSDGRTITLVRAATRSQVLAVGGGRGFAPHPEVPGLYLPAGFDLTPVVRPTVLARLFAIGD